MDTDARTSRATKTPKANKKRIARSARLNLVLQDAQSKQEEDRQERAPQPGPGPLFTLVSLVRTCAIHQSISPFSLRQDQCDGDHTHEQHKTAAAGKDENLS
jgi:hypothetical protein